MVETFDAVAIITAGISARISILSIYLTKKNDVTLEKLKSKLEIEKAEYDARRDYEYEARKRLYQNVNLFSFNLQSHLKAHLRIYALARNARDGNLGPDRYWLSTDHYFIR